MSHLHVDWLASAIDLLQSAAGRLLLVDRTELRHFLLTATSSLPRVHSPAETLILRSLLLEFAAEAGDAVHTRLHAATPLKPCRFVPAVFLEPLWKCKSTEPLTAFKKWLDSFCIALNHAHPLSEANRAAQVLRRDYHRQWDITGLAREVHATSSYLARAFRREYGRSMLDYQRDVRVVEALRRLRDTKIEVVALEVGYRSKKNLYALLNRAISMSPADFRRLRADAAQQIIDRACLQLVEAPVRRHTKLLTPRAQAADRGLKYSHRARLNKNPPVLCAR